MTSEVKPWRLQQWRTWRTDSLYRLDKRYLEQHPYHSLFTGLNDQRNTIQNTRPKKRKAYKRAG